MPEELMNQASPPPPAEGAPPASEAVQIQPLNTISLLDPPEKLPGFFRDYGEVFKEAKELTPEELDNLPPSVKAILVKARNSAIEEKNNVLAEAQKIKEEAFKTKEEAQRFLSGAELAQKKALETRTNAQTILKAPELVSAELGPEPVAFTPEWIDWKVKQGIQATLKPFFQGLSQATEEQVKAEQEAAQNAWKERRIGEIKAFREANPDFRELEPRIKELRKEYPAIQVEKLYYMAKGESRVSVQPQKQRESAVVGTIPQKITENLPTIEKMSGEELLDYMGKNPGEKDKIMQRLRERASF